MTIIPAFLCLLSLLFPLRTVQAESTREPSLRLAFLSDLHYIAPDLTDHGPLFQQVIANGDGKVTGYCNEITDAFISQIQQAHVDAVILQGDLTFNGAIRSHEVLSDKLSRLINAGIPVYVIPGNHDVYNSNAARFEGERFTRVESATSGRFREIWSAFGYEQALACAPDSLSYTVDLPQIVRLLMVDVNTEDNIGVLTDATYDWICTQLEDAKHAGRRVLAVSHQTIVPHNTLFQSGFIMTGAEKLAALYKSHQVLCNVSGHMHIQHCSSPDTGVPEIVVSSAAVAPCQFGLLTLYPDEAEYHTERIDVAGWAHQQGITNPDLLEFEQYALAFFTASTLGKAAALFERYPEAERQTLLLYLANLNAAYFRGDLTGYSASDSAFLRLTEGSDSWSLYLRSITPDLSQNYTAFRFPIHLSSGGNVN